MTIRTLIDLNSHSCRLNVTLTFLISNMPPVLVNSSPEGSLVPTDQSTTEMKGNVTLIISLSPE